MSSIPQVSSEYNRTVAREGHLILKNRYFEKNPVLNPEGVSSIARPALRYLTNVGTGPIRCVYSCPGTFSDNVFFVTGNDLYRMNSSLTSTFIGTVTSLPTTSIVMVATGEIGTVTPHLFITDGAILWVYLESGFAKGVLTASANVSAGDTVTIGTTVYSFTAGSVDAGTPAGTLANPWLLRIGATVTDSLEILENAVNAQGVAGTDYSTALTANPDATVYTVSGSSLYVHASLEGTIGNGVVTTETSATLSWGAGLLSGGGSPSLTQVKTPDDVGIISLGYINNYVILVPMQGEGINGRFYWINPGEVTIDPLNFATAERSPDPIRNVLVFADKFWLLGQSTTEPWITSGDPASPMERYDGVLFDRGSWEGTALQVKDSIILVDNDGGVFQVGGGIKRISDPSIEERIRKAIQEIS